VVYYIMYFKYIFEFSYFKNILNKTSDQNWYKKSNIKHLETDGVYVYSKALNVGLWEDIIWPINAQHTLFLRSTGAHKKEMLH
jgi:hypothetical protein